MEYNLSICSKYAQRIGNEVGWLENIIQAGIKVMNGGIIKTNPLSVAGVPWINLQAERSAHKMQIVYLVNLFESFMQDFIAEKDGLTETDINVKDFWKNYLSVERTAWDSYCRSLTYPVNTSNSFMNIRYSLFVIEARYSIKYPAYLTPVMKELGSLRNCLVHYDGELLHQDKGGKNFKDTLSETTSFLELDSTIDKITDIDKNGYLAKVTFDLQTFVELCGGRISRPFDHANEI